MQNKITAIVFDSNYTEHDYESIEYLDYDFNFILRDSDDNIIELLHENRGYDCIIVVGKDIKCDELYLLPFSERKKWVEIDEFDKDIVCGSIINTLKLNINRDSRNSKMFSIFTCAFNTPKDYVERLYSSLLKQTYINWNWWVLDDSDDTVHNYFCDIKDPRIHVIKNITNHGNIGFNKHTIASVADGDYLVEVDHDDELTPDCLEMLLLAFEEYDDCDFVYSYAMEEIGGYPVYYGDGFALGLGYYEMQKINGTDFSIATTPDVNSLSIRHIVGLPNHVRCWKKEFYHKIGGHNIELSVLDDMDILIRTFLNGKMCKIPKVLYIQHEGDYVGERDNGTTAQSSRFKEIIRTGILLKEKYDSEIHEKLMRLGVEDPYWDENEKCSYIFEGVKPGTITLNYTLEL